MRRWINKDEEVCLPVSSVFRQGQSKKASRVDLKCGGARAGVTPTDGVASCQ